MIKVDTKDLKRLESDLVEFNRRALPFATRNTVNSAAFKGRQIAQGLVKRNMITRNQFTVRSIQVEQARTLNIKRQEALLGSTAGYMEKQEFGGVVMKTGSEGVAIPTSYSAGQSQDAQPRERLPRKPNKIQNIKLQNSRVKAKNRRQRNLIAIQSAAKSGHKFIYLDLGRTKGIFKVTGGKRRPKIKMVYDLTRPSVFVPRNPWLYPSTQEAAAFIPGLYVESIQFQLKRLGIFSAS